MNHIKQAVLKMRREALNELEIAENHLNIAESQYAIDRAIYKIDVADKKLQYSIKLSEYINMIPETKETKNPTLLQKAVEWYMKPFKEA